MEIDYASHFSALAHPQRLSVLRMLLRRYPDAVPAGEVAQALNVKSNTLSAYLAALRAAGFVTQERDGTSLRYAASPAGLSALFDGFLRECCQGRPDLCRGIGGDLQTKKGTDMPFRVLFLCTGNSARSIFAECLLRAIGGDRFEVHSAGTRPASQLNPLAVRMLAEKGHETDGLRAKHMSEYQNDAKAGFDFVFTVCDRAANEECPAWPGQPISGHWSTPDPVAVHGTEAERMLAFQTAYGMLQNRISAFVSLPLETLDNLALQHAVDDIARKD
ncbi:helix-turn-helix domain-containing protein [Gymnodinialimonas sp. 2305UL16-5]|uniref:arsenate reductase/protein-tyrosine-phosphatase family protein n=1 Tax=Gymnodinialimonas mytili TaxID=3126503 RepID=UPI0030B474E7